MKKIIIAIIVIAILVLIGFVYCRYNGDWKLFWSAVVGKMEEIPSAETGNMEMGETHIVRISNFAFSPREITIKQGDRIVWVNDDDAPHNIAIQTDTQGPLMYRGEEFELLFGAAGEFTYYCGIHPEMTGVIKVE